jgi:hypothetical protein
VVPTVSGMLAIADDYAENRPETAGLLAALRRARAEFDGEDVRIYREYRTAFAAWVAGNEFDLVAQAAVLRAYQPTVEGAPGLRQWQRVEAPLGEEMERNNAAWLLPDGIAALGSVLARTELFRGRVFTTCFDPLMEVAVTRAGGKFRRIAVVPERTGRTYPDPNGGDAVSIHHLHGYWRPDEAAGRRQLLHNPAYLIDHREALADNLADQIESDTDTICVLGHSGWDGILAAAVRRIAAGGRRLTVLWAAESVDHAQVVDALRAESGPQPAVTVLDGVNSDVLLPMLAEKMRVLPAAPGPVIRDRRHPAWEREIVSEPGTAPPDEPLDLLRQLDRRYQWERSWSHGPVPPGLVFWPVRLRSRPSVINMVQALAAAALSARGVEVTICLDDFNVDDAEESADRFRQDVRRWFDLVPNSQWPQIESLRHFIEAGEQTAADHGPRHLLRPTRPWDVAREALGDRNPSVLDLLMAAKVVPDLPEDQLIAQADKIVTALLSRGARHLMTPFTLWSQLNDLLVDRPTGTVMTLGGKEERKLWELWRFAFDHGVNQLYNPTIRSLTNQSLMLRWPDRGTLRHYLRDAMREPDWAEEGHYVRWLAQNAFLLPIYLCDLEPPTFRGSALDSWPAVCDAVTADGDVVDVIAEHVSTLYLGPSGN